MVEDCEDRSREHLNMLTERARQAIVDLVEARLHHHAEAHRSHNRRIAFWDLAAIDQVLDQLFDDGYRVVIAACIVGASSGSARRDGS